MKKFLTYLVLFSYAVVVIKPVLPIVADALAHIFWKLEHISVVHNHDGIHHVHDEIMKSGEKEQSQSSPAAFRPDVTASPHVAVQLCYEFSSTNKIKSHYPPSTFFFPNPSFQFDDPPPEISSLVSC